MLVAAGGGMMGQAFPNTISRTAAVVAPGLMVMAIILFMGKVSGAHLNPAVSVAFSLRGDFPWRRVPGYIVVQLAGAALAALVPARRSSTSRRRTVRTIPAGGYSAGRAFLMEAVLTLGLVSVILGTASGAQNIGMFGALGVGGYIALGRPVGKPDLGRIDEPRPHLRPRSGRRRTSPSYWVYVAGPLSVRRSRSASRSCCAAYGGGRAGSAAAQGALETEVRRPTSNEAPTSRCSRPGLLPPAGHA